VDGTLELEICSTAIGYMFTDCQAGKIQKYLVSDSWNFQALGFFTQRPNRERVSAESCSVTHINGFLVANFAISLI
jgi:hypothetical protein